MQLTANPLRSLTANDRQRSPAINYDLQIMWRKQEAD